jgi:hypothetical protein
VWVAAAFLLASGRGPSPPDRPPGRKEPRHWDLDPPVANSRIADSRDLDFSVMGGFSY